MTSFLLPLSPFPPFALTRAEYAPGLHARPGAVGYRVRIARTGVDFETFAESTFAIAGDGRTFFDEPLFVPSQTTHVTVSAVDRNYYEYYRTLSDPFAGAPPSRLEGGYGVFGSLVELTIRSLNVR